MSAEVKQNSYKFPVGDSFVCLDVMNDQVRVANATGALIWEQMLEDRTEEEIVATLLDTFNAAEITIRNDVRHFLESSDAKDNGDIEAIETYTRDTGFSPDRACSPVVASEYFLPSYRILINSELEELPALLDPLFTISRNSQSSYKTIEIEVFSTNGQWPIINDGETLDTGLSAEDTAMKCLREINGLVGKHQDYSSIVHASAVAKAGSGILFPALSGSGKTTLAAFLCQNGYRLVNDDTVTILADGMRLLPVPLSFSIKEGSWEILQAIYPDITSRRIFSRPPRRIRYLPPSNDQIQTTPVSCKLIIVPEFSPNITTTTIETIESAWLFEHMIKSGCIVERPVDPTSLAQLVSLIDRTPRYRVRYSSLDVATRAIDSLFVGVC